MNLRPWQASALAKAIGWLTEQHSDKHFLINAAPGAGKTFAACSIAKQLIDMHLIDRVVVIAPRAEVVRQWGRDFKTVTGRYMGQITGAGNIIEFDVCATWSAVEGLQDAFQAVCSSSRVLVICDEHHHAAVAAAWGSNASSAFASAKYVVVLTGTPIRSDGRQSLWLAYDDHGAIEHPEAGTYTLTYGEAVDLDYCRPATFHRHEGRFTIDFDGGEKVSVNSKQPADLTSTLARIPGLQRALDFYKLACVPQYENDKVTPKIDGYQGTMVEWAMAKLEDLRHRMPRAGGLVIAPSIEMANYMAKLIEKMDGEVPVIVHNQVTNVESRIEGFRQTDKRWIVSVAMISEGVDIPRLRVLIYLPSALTELAFRQAIGRVVRSAGPDDNTRAYVIMPSFDILEGYARKVEEEMSPPHRADQTHHSSKVCPICASEVPLTEKFCEACGHEFHPPQTRFKECQECHSLNPIRNKNCQNCGNSFESEFILTLDEALRTGAIVRGMELDETEVVEGESMAGVVRDLVVKSGDAALVKMIQRLPEESWARLKKLINDSSS